MQTALIKEMVDAHKGFAEIEKKLDEQFGKQALKKTAIYGWMQKAKLGLPMSKDSSHTGNPIDEQLLITIQKTIRINEYFSVRSLADKLHCHPNLISRYLTEELHFVFKHTRYIPHSLNFAQKKKGRKSLSSF